MAERIGRVFIEVDADIAKMNAKFGEAINKITDADGKFAEVGKRMAQTVERALNPTEALGNKITALGKAGVSAADTWRYLGDRIQRAMEIAQKNGRTIDPIVQQLYDAAKATKAFGDNAGSGFARLGQAMTDFARNPLAATQAGITSILEKMGPLAVGIAGIATAAVVAGAAILKMGFDAAEAGEQIENASMATGMTVEQVQALQRLGAETGVGDLTRKIELLNIQLGKGAGGDFTEAILKMNIAVKEGGGAVYYLEQMRQKLSEIPDRTKAAEEGAASLGRRLWHDLAPLLMNTSRSITDSLEAITRSGAVMSEQQIAGLLELDKQIDEHGRTWEALKNQVKIMAAEATLAFMKMVEKLAGGWQANLPQPDLGPEQLMQMEMGRTGKLDFSQYDRIKVVQTTMDELERRSMAVARADAIASGVKADLVDLTIKLKRAESEYQKERANQKGLEFDEAHLNALAIEISQTKQILNLMQDRDKIWKESVKIQKEIAAIQEGIDRAGHAALVPGKTEIAAGLKKADMEMAQRLRVYQEADLAATRDITRSSIERLRVEKQIVDTIVPLTKGQQQAYAIQKTHLEFEIRADEIILRYTQQITDLEAKIGKLLPTDPFRIAAQGKVDEIRAAMEQALDDLGAMENAQIVAIQQTTLREVAALWDGTVAGIVDSWSSGIVDMLSGAKSFSQTMKAIFVDMGKSLLKALVDTLFTPIKNYFSKMMGDILSGLSTGGNAKSTAASGASAAGIMGIFGNPAAMMATGGLTASLAGIMSGNKYAAGAGAVGLYGTGMGVAISAATGMPLGSALAATLLNPITAAIMGGVVGIIAIIDAFTHDAWEAGKMEIERDLGGLKVKEKDWRSWIQTNLGLSEDQAYPIRKDIMTSPLFMSQIAVPAAQSQGRIDALLKSLERVTVDTRIAASGFLNFRAAVETGIKTGNWEAFNKQWSEAFAKSQALTAVMPDFASKLMAVSNAASDAADAATGLSDGMQALLDAILSSSDAADDMYGTFLKTGEILPQLAEEIQKYGGNLAVFQKYASLGPLRENLSAITDLMSGLNDLLPDLGPIQSILQGQGFGAGGWDQLTAMGVDPSKLIGMADLVAFESRWEESVRQFQDTGRLLSGSVLQQALWKFGGTAGATALSRWDQGFNTITPGLLDMTKSAMDVAYKTERETALDYLKGVQTTMESEIQAATDSIVAELQNILAAIEAGNAATVPITPAATTPETVASQGGVYVDMRGATVYGYEDFEGRVQAAWNSAYRRGAFGYAVP